MLTPASTYSDCIRNFRWDIPARFNMAEACCDRHAAARPAAPALIVAQNDRTNIWTFRHLQTAANHFANMLEGLGIGRGERVAIHLPQCPETAIAHLGSYKAGAVALPLFTLFGPDALRYRLNDSGAVLLITNQDGLARIGEDLSEFETLRHVISVDSPSGPVLGWAELMAQASPEYVTVDTAAEDPALIIYTSGTTGPPKGVLHAHRVLLGHLPGVEFPHRFFPQKGDLFWTPADWAWIGGLMDVLMPSFYHGKPVLCHRARKFDPEEAFSLMARHMVRNVFMPPTALRLMAQVKDPARFGVDLRSLGSGGEALGADMLHWGAETFGLTISEFYGQTEVNLVVGTNGDLMAARPGSMGRAMPGHEVAVVGDDGHELPTGEQGIIAIRRPDPVMFLEYWNNPDATAEKFIGDWCLTGDVAVRDTDGYFWFKGRADDLILSAGYRIGPAEVEECLTTHPAVTLAGVVGTPDKIRGEAIKAFVVLNPGFTPSDDLKSEIQSHVRVRLAAHEYPREIVFIDEMPLTATGKIRRMDLRSYINSSSSQDPSSPRRRGSNPTISNR